MDIETLIGKLDYLLVEGQAGSGKTTVLKHLTYCLAMEGKDGFGIPGLEGYLPIMIFFKDLQDYFDALDDRDNSRLNARDLLEWYLKNKVGDMLENKILEGFIKERKAVFLIDGLDETIPKDRDKVVKAFSDLQIKNRGIKVSYPAGPTAWRVPPSTYSESGM